MTGNAAPVALAQRILELLNEVDQATAATALEVAALLRDLQQQQNERATTAAVLQRFGLSVT